MTLFHFPRFLGKFFSGTRFREECFQQIHKSHERKGGFEKSLITFNQWEEGGESHFYVMFHSASKFAFELALNAVVT